MQRLISLPILAGVLLLGALAGCNRGSQEKSTGEQVIAPVAKPVQDKVQDFVDYTGRTNATVSVVIQSRVTGYLVRMPFKEGANVKKGDLLFQIDPRPFKAQLDAATAQKQAADSQLAVNRAKLVYARTTNKRYKELAAENRGAVSQRELDQYQALDDQAFANVVLAEANVSLAEANLEQPRLNMEWTDVRAPIDGQVSRYYLTLGNLVNQDSTQLTTIMSIDPMYVYFDMDEPTMLRIKQAIHEGKIKTTKGSMPTLPSNGTYTGMVGELAGLPMSGPLPALTWLRPRETVDAPVYMALQGEDDFEDVITRKPRHLGTINFVDNQVNAGTDSIQVRGVFENKKLVGGDNQLVPGMFVRIRLPIGQEEERLLVNDKAIISEQGQKKLFIVNDKNVVEERIVTLGPLRADELRVVSGPKLSQNDWVVYTNFQQLRPKMEVTRVRTTMPRKGVPEKPLD